MLKVLEFLDSVVSVETRPEGKYHIVYYRNRKTGKFRIYVYDKQDPNKRVLFVLQRVET